MSNRHVELECESLGAGRGPAKWRLLSSFSFFGWTVRRKPYDRRSLPLTESTAGAGYVLVRDRRAYHYLSALGSFRVVHLVRWHNDSDRRNIQRGELIRFSKGVGAEIDREPICVCFGDRQPILLIGKHVKVGIRKSALTRIRSCERHQSRPGDRYLIVARQIARLIVAPERVGRLIPHGREQFIKAIDGNASADLLTSLGSVEPGPDVVTEMA